MINSATIVGCWLLFGVGQVDPAAITSRADRATPIVPKRSIAARVIRVIHVAPPETPLLMPTDVKVGQNGVIHVADGVNNRVVMIDASGSFLGEWSNVGDVTLNNPIGLAIDAENQLWITDNGHHRVVRVSADRSEAQVITFDVPVVKANSTPIDPTGIAVSPDGKLTFVVDNDNHRILVRDNVSGAVRAVGSAGSALGQLQWPFLVALDGDGALYVTEAIGARVQRLSSELQWTSAIGRWGVSEGQLYRPKGIVIEKDGRVLVSDSTLGAVQLFSTRGRFLGVLADDAGHVLRFAHPMGMAIDSAGRLLIVEAGANQMSVVEFAAADNGEGKP